MGLTASTKYQTLAILLPKEKIQIKQLRGKRARRPHRVDMSSDNQQQRNRAIILSSPFFFRYGTFFAESKTK